MYIIHILLFKYRQKNFKHRPQVLIFYCEFTSYLPHFQGTDNSINLLLILGKQLKIIIPQNSKKLFYLNNNNKKKINSRLC